MKCSDPYNPFIIVKLAFSPYILFREWNNIFFIVFTYLRIHVVLEVQMYTLEIRVLKKFSTPFFRISREVWDCEKCLLLVPTAKKTKTGVYFQYSPSCVFWSLILMTLCKCNLNWISTYLHICSNSKYHSSSWIQKYLFFTTMLI